MNCLNVDTVFSMTRLHGVLFAKFERRRRGNCYEISRSFLEILVRKKRGRSVVSVPDVDVPGAFDAQYVLGKRDHLYIGDRFVVLGNLSGNVEKHISETKRKPSFFKIFFKDQELVSLDGEQMERQKDAYL